MRGTSTEGPIKVAARLASGEVKQYYYAWRGGPRLPGEPGSPEFKAAYAAAIAKRKLGLAEGTLAGLVIAYKASPEFEAGHADSTKAEWRRHLDAIMETRHQLAIGALPMKVLSDDRVKQHFMAWRDRWSGTPRKADYALQVLSAVLSWAKQRGLISANVLIGHPALYSNNRADLIWSDDEVERYCAAAPSPEVMFIVLLACATGLRRADLVSLLWTDIGDVAITIEPNKQRRRSRPKRIIVPLFDETLLLLEMIREQQAKRWQELAARAARKGRPASSRPLTVLTNTRCKPWTEDGAEHQIIDTKHAAGIEKHLHDCRGTFATRLRKLGATHAEIADVLGWAEERVERLMSMYVDNDAVVRAFAERLRAKESAAKKRPDEKNN